MRYVAVVGSSVATGDEERIAQETGRLIAEAGWVLVCGGLDGVMAAACRGAKTSGGTTVGILPGDDRGAANPWVDIAIPTGMGEARNALVVRSSDAIVAIGGEFGTLSEVALALKLGRPVIGLGTWSLTRDGLSMDPILRATDPAHAVRLALERIG